MIEKTTIETMKELVAIQASQGNWNYDAYMQGMYNGMELMLAIAENREPDYKKAPEKWLKDLPQDQLKTEAFAKLHKGQQR